MEINNKLTKQELLIKCEELGIFKCKSKNKTELINLILEKNKEIINDNDNNNELIDYNKCDIFTPDAISQIMASKINIKGNLLDPCVGTGNLLKFINIQNYDDIDVYEIKKRIFRSNKYSKY
jgi:hypothetical protein